MNEQRSRWFSILVLLFFIGASAAIGYYFTKHPIAWPQKPTLQPGYYQVIAFHDGDTISVNMQGQEEKVRFIGVDTPETQDPRKPVQCFGQAASDYTRQLISNQPVRLEADSQSTNRDRYGRLLRYVYLEDGRLVNAEIIKQGYGFAYTGFPFEKVEEFKRYQADAMQAKHGLWASCHPIPTEYGGFTSS